MWSNVPQPLQLTPRWSTWRYFDRDGRKAKVPSARVNDPRTWMTFEDAVSRAEVPSVRDHGGIGFLLGDGWSGVDLDAVIVDGQLRDDVYPILGEIRGYQEISPSGNGVKCIGRGDRVGLELNYKNTPLPSPGVTTEPAVTLWTGPRFFTVTGRILPTSRDPLLDLNLDRWPGKSVSPRLEYETPAWLPVGDLRGTEGIPHMKTGRDLEDDALLQIAYRHTKFILLWGNDTADYDNDHSRADAALCAMLAYYTGRDPERIDRLFRKSGLFRDKWNTNSYRTVTIRKAIALSSSMWGRAPWETDR